MLIKFIENYTKIDNIKLLNSSQKCLDNPKHNILVLTKLDKNLICLLYYVCFGLFQVHVKFVFGVDLTEFSIGFIRKEKFRTIF